MCSIIKTSYFEEFDKIFLMIDQRTRSLFAMYGNICTFKHYPLKLEIKYETGDKTYYNANSVNKITNPKWKFNIFSNDELSCNSDLYDFYNYFCFKEIVKIYQQRLTQAKISDFRYFNNIN